MLRVVPDAGIAWQSSSVLREGYLVGGQFQYSECVDGEPYTGIYTTGGYFNRPADAVSGGPETAALSESIWFLRESGASTETENVACTAAAE